MNKKLGSISRPKLVFVGNASRLLNIGGKEVLASQKTSVIGLLRGLFESEIVFTIRWWDPLITILRLLRPGIITVFVADGHFSLLNLNKAENKRDGKNILESGYCDIYLLPDKISMNASSLYPCLVSIFRPWYWDDPGMYLLDCGSMKYDIVFVYGNDPFFGGDNQNRLLLLVNQITRYFSRKYSVAHVVPKGRNGTIIANSISDEENIFFGLVASREVLSKGAIYLCTPSTLVWQLMAASGKVALIDVYDEDSCFHPSVPRVSKPEDVLDVIDRNDEYWVSLWKKLDDIVGKRPLAEVLESICDIKPGNKNNRAEAWKKLGVYKFRDFLSSIWSIFVKK